MRVHRSEHRVRFVRSSELPERGQCVLRRLDVQGLERPGSLRDPARDDLHESAVGGRGGRRRGGARRVRRTGLSGRVPALHGAGDDLVLRARRRGGHRLRLHVAGRSRPGEQLRLLTYGLSKHAVLRTGRMARAGAPVRVQCSQLRRQPTGLRMLTGLLLADERDLRDPLLLRVRRRLQLSCFGVLRVRNRRDELQHRRRELPHGATLGRQLLHLCSLVRRPRPFGSRPRKVGRRRAL